MCKSLRLVTFGSSCNLEHIGAEAFTATDLESFIIPDSVIEVGDMCFYKCRSLRQVTVSATSKLQCLGARAFELTPVDTGALRERLLRS